LTDDDAYQTANSSVAMMYSARHLFASALLCSPLGRRYQETVTDVTRLTMSEGPGCYEAAAPKGVAESDIRHSQPDSERDTPMKRSLTEQPRDVLVTLTPEQAGAVSGGQLIAAGTVTKVACCLGCASYGRPGFADLVESTGVA
jgi:hypothetical protein